MSSIMNGDHEQSGGEEKIKEPHTPAYKKIDISDPNIKCVLCNSSQRDPVNYGELYQIDDAVSHYFCLLFSSNLCQNGDDHEGILGFLAKDIKKEVRRGSRLKCSYCRRSGASIGCHLKSCRKTFHLPCGLKHGSMHQYFGHFLSFCSVHRPSQRVNVTEKDNDSAICVICCEEVPREVSHNTLWAPCCKKQWFHRGCLQRQALAQGYFFKCPMCNNKTDFNLEMKKFGIYIPEMDAAWEREPQAFQDLLTTYNTCDASKCKCPDGRNFSQNTGSWRLLRCNSCGSQGTHIGCSCLKIGAPSRSWCCQMCLEVISRANKRPVLEAVPEGDHVQRSTWSQTDTAATSSISVSEASNISLRRPPAITSKLQANKTRKRKSSSQITHIDEGSSSSGSESEHNDRKCVLAKFKINIQNQDLLPGPSRVKSSDEDDIVIVDDTDSDIEVVDEVMQKKSLCPERIFPVPQCHSKELLDKEGKTIMGNEVSAEVTPVPVEVKMNLLPKMKNSRTAETYSSGQMQKSKLSTDCSVIKTSASQCEPIKKVDLISRPSSSEEVSSPLIQNVNNLSRASTGHDYNTTCETSDDHAVIGIRIDNVRHSNELFSPSRTQESQSTSQHPSTQSLSEPLQMFPFGDAYQMHHFAAQQPIYFIPTKTVDGQTALQAMVPLSSYTMSQQQQFMHSQTSRRDQARTPPIVTLE